MAFQLEIVFGLFSAKSPTVCSSVWPFDLHGVWGREPRRRTARLQSRLGVLCSTCTTIRPAHWRELGRVKTLSEFNILQLISNYLFSSYSFLPLIVSLPWIVFAATIQFIKYKIFILRKLFEMFYVLQIQKKNCFRGNKILETTISGKIVKSKFLLMKR